MQRKLVTEDRDEREKDQMSKRLMNIINEVLLNTEDRVIEAMKEMMPINTKYVDNRTGYTLLTFTIAKECFKTANILIENGADVNCAGETGKTPLIAAAGSGNLDTVKLLISKGANVNHFSILGYTALMLAVLIRSMDIVQLLIKNGANVNHADNNGKTALIYAVKYKSPGIIELLIKNGADVNHTDRHGNTALDIARTNGYDSIVDTLNSANVFTRSDGYLPSGAGAGAGAGAGEADKAEVDAKTSGRCVISK